MANTRIPPKKINPQKTKPKQLSVDQIVDHQNPNPPKQTADGLIVHPDYFDRVKGKIEDYMLAKVEGRSDKPLECPVCGGTRAYPGDRFGNLVPNCSPVDGEFDTDDFSGECDAGEYLWAISGGIHFMDIIPGS